jgi:hypothetical protein
MVTKNNIQTWFNDFADNHTQLKDYGYGDFSDISMERATTYPLMWVSPQPCTIEGNQISYVYTIAIADRVDKERLNAVEVESDTFQICLDILAAANDQATISEWQLLETSTLTPFFETWKDEVEGHMVTLTLVVDFNYDKCQIPTISAIEPPNNPSCADGRVNVNLTFYDDVPSGNTLNVVVKDTDGDLVGSLIADEWIVPSASQTTQIKGYWGAGVTDMIQLTIDSDNAGTYTSISDNGSSGTITIRKNGGAFGAFSNPLVLAVADTLDVKRTTSTSIGFFKIVGTY